MTWDLPHLDSEHVTLYFRLPFRIMVYSSRFRVSHSSFISLLLCRQHQQSSFEGESEMRMRLFWICSWFMYLGPSWQGLHLGSRAPREKKERKIHNGDHRTQTVHKFLEGTRSRAPQKVVLRIHVSCLLMALRAWKDATKLALTLIVVWVWAKNACSNDWKTESTLRGNYRADFDRVFSFVVRFCRTSF